MGATTEMAAMELDEVTYTGTQSKILQMLGNGLSPAIVATAMGVSEGYISQLLAEESFARQVTNLRFESLQAATARDRSYDSIEDTLISKMQDLLPMMYKPMEVLRAITVINAAKRRGNPVAEGTIIHNTVIQLVLPTAVLNKFTKTIDNQVVNTGDTDLITISSKSLSDKLATFKSTRLDSKPDSRPPPQQLPAPTLPQVNSNTEHNTEYSHDNPDSNNRLRNT